MQRENLRADIPANRTPGDAIREGEDIHHEHAHDSDEADRAGGLEGAVLVRIAAGADAGGEDEHGEGAEGGAEEQPEAVAAVVNAFEGEGEGGNELDDAEEAGEEEGGADGGEACGLLGMD